MNNTLLSLLHLTDSTLPIGSFSHSAGLETYVQKGIVKNKTTAKEFITEMLTQNLQYSDATFVSLVYDAATTNDINKIIEIDEMCTAIKLPFEMRQASNKLGIRLLKIFQPIFKSDMADKYKEAMQLQKINGHYCIVFGIYAQALGISKSDALYGFYYNAAAGFVTNSVKLIPLGQQDGQQILFSLQPLIQTLVEKTLNPNKDLIGLCCAGFDIRSMQHEKLYSRLYMS